MKFLKMRRGNVAALLLITSFLFLSSCFHGDKTAVNGALLPPNVVELNVYPANIKVTQIGAEVALTVRAVDDKSEDVTSRLDGIIWQSSDESVATVDSNGLVSIIATGPVTISASYDNVKDSSLIEVGVSNQSIQGVARYEDVFYGVAGTDIPDETRYKNIRHAIVDLLDIDGNILDTSTTSELGLFGFGPIIPDKYSIRIIAKLDSNYFENVEISDFSGQIYAATFSSAEDDSTPYQLDISQNSSIAGAFNLLDTVTASAEFSQNRLGVTSRDLSVYWEKGYTSGTYYCPEKDTSVCKMGKGIYILSERSSFSPSDDDTDEFDDDVIFHEFSHYLADNYASDDSAGGLHNLVQNDSDLRLAWSEGWGLFLPSAIKSWLLMNKPYLLSTTSDVSFYIDTTGSIPGSKKVQISYDINTPSFVINRETGDLAPDSSFHYASSEAAIAKILWDLHESTTSGMALIWDSISVGMIGLSSPTNLASFWDGILSSDISSEADISALTTTLNIRQIFYEDDVSEPDDSPQQATFYSVGVTEPVTNYLYRGVGESGDEDYFKFDAVVGETYEIRATDLRNGIDTSISILDANGNVVVQDGTALANDDDVDAPGYFRFDRGCNCSRVINDGVSLASKLIFTPVLNGRYTIRVWYSDKFAKKINSTGHYGTYTLSIDLVPGS